MLEGDIAMHADCQLCESMNTQNALSHSDTCLLQYDAEVSPQGCAIVSPLRQVSLVFDLSPSEWEDTYIAYGSEGLFR